MAARVEVSSAELKVVREYIEANYEPGDILDPDRVASETKIEVDRIIEMLGNRGQAIVAPALTEDGERATIFKAPGDRLYEAARPLIEYRDNIPDEDLVLKLASQNRPKGRHQPPDDPTPRWS